jgi:hypothetical protein
MKIFSFAAGLAIFVFPWKKDRLLKRKRGKFKPKEVS